MELHRETSAASSNYDTGAQFDVDVKVLASKWFVKLRNKVFKDQCLKGAPAHCSWPYSIAIHLLVHIRAPKIEL